MGAGEFRKRPVCAAWAQFNCAVGAGHLFVLRGDLRRLHCSAVFVPCDSRWDLVWDDWKDILPPHRFAPSPAYPGRYRLIGGGGDGRFTDLDRGDRRVRLVVAADDGRHAPSIEETAQWVCSGIVEAIRDWAISAGSVAGRVMPLIGLPLVGTGAGGFRLQRGVLINALVPKLRAAARAHNVDIALVLNDARDHAAIQAVREADYWPQFAAHELQIADRLGVQACEGQLSLFLGSGVGVPLGLPDWHGLLEEVGGHKLAHFRPEDAPEIAQKIEREVGEDAFRPMIAKTLQRVDGVAPTHLLLASLLVRQTVTTNYDTAYERALDSI